MRVPASANLTTVQPGLVVRHPQRYHPIHIIPGLLEEQPSSGVWVDQSSVDVTLIQGSPARSADANMSRDLGHCQQLGVGRPRAARGLVARLLSITLFVVALASPRKWDCRLGCLPERLLATVSSPLFLFSIGHGLQRFLNTNVPRT